MLDQPAIETIEAPLHGYKSPIAESTAARHDPNPKAIMELVENITLKNINDNLLKFTGKSFRGSIIRSAVPSSQVKY